MILLDTHIWVWWANQSADLKRIYRETIESHQNEGLGVSIISCWEVANLVRLNRLELRIPIREWVSKALMLKGIQLIDLTPEIAIAATLLQEFHKDPADRFLVATARTLDIPIVTQDARIVGYPLVESIPSA